MTNLEALKALYVALGGNSSTVANMTTSAEVINAMCSVAETLATAATTAELPKVSATNNGQVLTVVSGKWAAAALPANSNT